MHSHHLLHLVPRPTAYQECLEHEISIEPAPQRRVEELDAFGNPMLRIELAQPHRELAVTSQMQIVVHRAPRGARGNHPGMGEACRNLFAYRGAWPSRDELEAARFRHESPHVRIKQAIHGLLGGVLPSGQTHPRVRERPCAAKLHAEITYAPGETTIGTPSTELLETRRGVCQDFAHLMIACLRSRGLPARYVSGYLRTNPPADPDRRTSGWWAMAPRMPGWPCGVRRTGGSSSIPPMAVLPARITWPWPGDGTSVTFHLCAA